MVSPWASLSIHLKKRLTRETKAITLELYRSLLKTTQRFKDESHKTFMWNTVKERFRFEKYNSSRSKTLTLLLQGEKGLQLMREAQQGNTLFIDRINAMVHGEVGPLHHTLQRLRKLHHPLRRVLAATDIRSRASRLRNPKNPNRIPLPTALCEKVRLKEELPRTRRQRQDLIARINKKKPKQPRIRTLYQKALTAYSSAGHEFKRVRGWRQPLRTSMMIKKRVKTIQKRLDASAIIEGHIEMLKGEDLFLNYLNMPNVYEHQGECIEGV
ncbi:hypothetical protein BDF14DRAFT_1775496 [Spinellus fusiger]|nr:hypothetical protein BDF14DRAFT_1775496 [Spinellus fusiger]